MTLRQLAEFIDAAMTEWEALDGFRPGCFYYVAQKLRDAGHVVIDEA